MGVGTDVFIIGLAGETVKGKAGCYARLCDFRAR